MLQPFLITTGKRKNRASEREKRIEMQFKTLGNSHHSLLFDVDGSQAQMKLNFSSNPGRRMKIH